MSSMFLRAYRLCSPQYLEDELTLLKCNFKKLGYKENFISDAMFKARKRFYNYNTRSNFSTDNILKLPTSLNLNIKSLLPKNINIIYGNNNNIKKFFSHSQTLNENNINVVYTIPCRDCSECYVGETVDFSRRMYQHDYDLRMGNKSSALHQHRCENNHKILIKDAKIICREKNIFLRKLLESFVIRNSNTFNNNKMSLDVDDFVLNSLKLIPKFKKLIYCEKKK